MDSIMEVHGLSLFSVHIHSNPFIQFIVNIIKQESESKVG
jgi:hypothetical protein